mgnify:CR=1 FL=1
MIFTSVAEIEYIANSPDKGDQVPDFPKLESYMIENVTDMYISMKLNFSSSLEISQSSDKDFLKIIFPVHQLFVA